MWMVLSLRWHKVYGSWWPNLTPLMQVGRCLSVKLVQSVTRYVFGHIISERRGLNDGRVFIDVVSFAGDAFALMG